MHVKKPDARGAFGLAVNPNLSQTDGAILLSKFDSVDNHLLAFVGRFDGPVAVGL